MSVLVILLGISLCVGLGFLAAFIWSVKSGQFEDDYSPAHKLFFEEETPTDTHKQ
ncbi:cbb3-type cytochrome oxidase assembly protein CcoS [Taibaiella sp. KBW10]|uniref:cbb3-type cytochrome oxidase assembly protein CcoS n=1 Tax=Taibaiella sp. KBW10 TaxID=2153357 RepID=UPI000F5B75F4|nr:cbb3-type cytochrome oxidase assembly protein CcoS [Taibaiella sp. KBW10]RQO30067.1 cbb3-type cytochrome oxidase assembly protein CcoS [Taibaiella sp. KBW10]